MLIIKTNPWYKNRILHIGVLVLISCAMLFPNIQDSPLNSWDEARHAINALEMINSGDWVTVTYDNAPDMANIKFPLGAWLIAINYKIFGVTEFSVRLWSVIFTILTTIIIYLLGSLIKDRWTGILAALVFITSMQVIAGHAGTTGDYDAGASFFVALSLLLFMVFIKNEKRGFLISSMVAVGIGAMYKSFVPGFMPLGIIFIYLLFSKKFRYLLNLKNILICAGIIAVIVSPWLIARSMSDSSFVFKLLNFDYWSRLTEAVDNHSAPFWFYMAQMGNGFYPWVYFLPLGLFLVFREYARDKEENYLFLLVWFFVVLLIFSVASTKNFWYILPIFPVASLMVALFWRHLFKIFAKLKFAKVLLIISSVFLIVNFASAISNTKYFLNTKKNINNFPVFINKESVKKELLSSDLIVHEYVATQGNLFYLKRLLSDNFSINSNLTCDFQNDQLWLISSDADFLRIFLKNCPTRQVVANHIAGNSNFIYSLIK